MRNLTKVYDPSPLWLRFLLRTAITTPVRALGGLSFDVASGEVCAVIGPNGAGKSTLFRVLTGLTTATSGTAEVMGIDVAQQPHAVRRVVGFMPSSDQTIYLRHSCRENLVFHGRLQGMSDEVLRQRVPETLNLVGIDYAADRIGFALSAGMRARLQLARALLHHPSVLILDEPTGVVDPVASYELLEIIQQAANETGVSVLLSSHRLEEIEALHDRVLLLDRGTVAYDGDINSLRRSWQLPTLDLRFVSNEDALAATIILKTIPEVEITRIEGTHVVVATSIGTGRLLQHLDGQLTGLASLSESIIPLRELLGKMLGAHTEGDSA